jgi:Raf kinase inhibitor-like YbhB/YbcL family protein
VGWRDRRPERTRFRIIALVTTGLLAVGLAAAVPPAIAAPTRYEAENATISQGAVESNHPGFSGAGFVNTDNVVGSSVQWTVNAPSAGTATLTFQYANGTTVDRPMSISVNGSTVSAALSFLPTTDWNTWASTSMTAALNAGTNTVKATATTANGGPNLDFLDVDIAAPTTDLQAENATISQATVATNHTGFTGTGFVDYNNVAGSFVEWQVNAARAGNVDFQIRYANGSTANRPMAIAVNGTVVQPALAFPPTGNWDTWQDATFTAALVNGANTVRATATVAAGGPNVDRLRVSLPTDNEPPTAPGNLRVVGDVKPNSVDLAWDAATDNVGVALYRIFDLGNVVAEVGGNVTTVTVRNLTANKRYVLHALAIDGAGNVSGPSNNVDFTTPPSDDTQPPSVPTGLRATNVAATSVTLAWTASTDNVRVAGYNVYRDGVKFATVPDLTATADGLTPSTQYSFTVDAFDDNGNTSAQSAPPLMVTTGSTATGGDPIFDREITRLDLPWGIGFLPDGSALVAERDRFEIVRVTLNGQKTVVGKITEAVTTGGEGGLLGLAISPNFATDHFVYVFHTAASDNRLVRFKFENNTVGPREALVTGIAKNRFHNGGRIRFGPDGFLYIATGDGQDGTRAQNLNSLNGKILRVTMTGAGAPGNPFASAPRVYSLGHRNVQGLAWDSQNRLWASEFGDSTFDELNLIQPGRNYGWPNCEGPCNDSRFTNPVRTWDVASASPSGLEIVNDWIYMAAVRGSRLWVMKIQGNGTDTPRAFFNGRWGRLRTVVKTPDGGLWLTSTNNDKNGGTPDVLDNVIVRLKFAGAPFALSSTAFANNGTIPIRYTCQQDHAAGNDISPPLSWGAGANTPQSYAITLIDTANGNKHWVIWDIPAGTTSLPEGLGGGFNVPNQAPAKQKALGGTSTNTMYFGPCPGGSSHRYEFTLYAVDTATLPGVGAGSTVAQVETAILAHDLASVKLVGNSAAQA